MRKLVLAAIVLATIVSCSSQKSNVEIDRKIRNIENGLVEFTTPADMFQADSVGTDDLKTLTGRMEHYRVPGVSIAVINDYALEWAKPYGVMKVGDDKAVTTETYFQAASTSKLVTAAIVLHFVEHGLLNLEEDVNVYLRSWKVPDNEFTGKQKVTLRLLLTHQAGLPSTNFPQAKDAGDPTLVQVLKGESPAMNEPATLECVPGTEWQYSNLGFVVIQQILEDVLNKPFAQIAQETVFQPLGMKNSTFVYPLEQGLQEGEAMPHDADGFAREPSMPPTAVAHGGLMTTPSDLGLFTAELMKAYKGRSDLVISEETARQMFRKELDLDPRMFGIELGEGLGVMIYGEGKNLIFAHPGSNLPGMNCWLLGQPESGKGAVIMTNGVAGEILAMEIISGIIREYEWLAAGS